MNQTVSSLNKILHNYLGIGTCVILITGRRCKNYDWCELQPINLATRPIVQKDMLKSLK